MKMRIVLGAALAAALAVLALLCWRQIGGVSHAQIHAAVTGGTEAVLDRVDGLGDRLETRLDGVEDKLDSLEAKLDKILELAARPLPDGMRPAR